MTLKPESHLQGSKFPLRGVPYSCFYTIEDQPRMEIDSDVHVFPISYINPHNKFSIQRAIGPHTYIT